MKIAVLLIVMLAVPHAWGQDVDTIVLKNDDRKFTIVSQIEDPGGSGCFYVRARCKGAGAAT